MNKSFLSIVNVSARSWILLFALALSGCSTFNREWKTAAATPIRADDVQGRWEGKWLSDVNGHTGKLRCLLTKLDGQQYRARFKATYWKILRFTYPAILSFERVDGRFDLHGETDLGWWGGGVYHYSGSVTPTNFLATYKSEHDHGTFRMSRPTE